MVLKCGRADCTVAETGVCLLNNDPPASCPERVPVDEGRGADGPAKEYFPPSRACTLRDARELMGRRYMQIVGVLGEPDAGKTACLVSLYLLLGRDRLNGFRFADSTTLRGFEEISRGARRWDRAQPPQELTHHTKLSSDRSASFLHLRLARSGGATGAVDLLMSDLPGEWTTELVSEGRVDRLAFLKRADVIWLVVDGDRLRRSETRQLSRHRIGLLAGRLGTFLSDTKPSLVFVVTRRDHGALERESLAAVRAVGEGAGFDAKVVEVAPFADVDGDVEPGHGIGDLIGKTTESRASTGTLQFEGVDDTSAMLEIGLTRGG